MYTHLPYPSANVYQFYIYFISNVYPITIAQRQPSASPAQAQRSPALLSATLMTPPVSPVSLIIARRDQKKKNRRI